jgi:hypothetical protein
VHLLKEGSSKWATAVADLSRNIQNSAAALAKKAGELFIAAGTAN